MWNTQRPKRHKVDQRRNQWNRWILDCSHLLPWGCRMGIIYLSLLLCIFLAVIKISQFHVSYPKCSWIPNPALCHYLSYFSSLLATSSLFFFCSYLIPTSQNGSQNVFHMLIESSMVIHLWKMRILQLGSEWHG